MLLPQMVGQQQSPKDPLLQNLILSQYNKIDRINHELLLFKLVGHTTLPIAVSLCFSNFSGRKKDAHFNHSFKHLQEYKIQHFPEGRRV